MKLPSLRLNMRLLLLLLLSLTLTILCAAHGKPSDSDTLEDFGSPTLSASPSEVENSRTRRAYYGYGDSHYYRFGHPLSAHWRSSSSSHYGYHDFVPHYDYHHHPQSYQDAWPFHGTPRFYHYIHRDGLCSFDKPFLCWGSKTCVRLSHVCDGSYDCPNHIDEHPDICIAGKRPSVDNMEEFLEAQKAWIVPHLFNNAAVGAIAQALKNVENVEQLRWRLSLKENNVVNIKAAFEAARSDNSTTLEALGMEKTSWQTVKYFFTSLSETGFSTS